MTPRLRGLRSGPIGLRWGLIGLGAVLVLTAFTFLLLDRSKGTPQLLADLFFLAVPTAWAVVGGLVAARHPDNQVGWLCLTIGLLWGINDAGTAIAGWAAHRGLLTTADWANVTEAFWLPAVCTTAILALRLPTGRLLSSRWRPFSWFCVATILVVGAVVLTTQGRVDGVVGTSNPVASDAVQSLAPLFALMPLVIVGAIGSLVVRYRRSGMVERLQIRWIAFGGLVFLMIGLVLLAVVGNAGEFSPGLEAVDVVANLAIPISIGIAMLRYRLYDIDVVINRALVYGALTAVLAGAYLGLVLLLGLALAPLTSQSDLAIALSTLAVAALFQPVRRRVQTLVDRRFYRHKYDAARTLERFGARLRSETDLEALRAELTRVVSDTMQPAHVSLWLRGTGR
jgi:hypothetical protein